MRILLDESLPRPLGLALIGHDVSTVHAESWTSFSNGALLRQAAVTFDVVLTADRNIEFQQNLPTLPIAVVVLVANSNRLESLEPLIPQVLELLETLSPKTLVRVGVNAGSPARRLRRVRCNWLLGDKRVGKRYSMKKSTLPSSRS